MSRNTIHTKYLIIGAGLAGLSAAYHLEDGYEIFEASDSAGGTASTLFYKGFKLDNAVHILYFRSNVILEWIKDNFHVELLEKKRVSSVWLNNSYVNFPVQYNLSELPFASQLKSVTSILGSFFRSSFKTFKDFETYSYTTFGNYLTSIFIKPYNEKLFGVPLSQMNTDWLGDYVPKNSRIKMLSSIFNILSEAYGRNLKYYYPSEGGISVLAENISSQLHKSPNYRSSLEKIFVDEKVALFSNDTEVNYDYLINTIPLNSFLNKLDSLPLDISDSLKLLKKNSTTLLHVLGKGIITRNDHWIYIPDPAIPFYRITIPGNINPANCPADHFALTLEFGGNVFEDQVVFEKIISALKAMGLLTESNSNIEYYWKLLDCGYVIYDEKRKSSLEKIFSFLQSNQIWSIGRYGAWEYSNMEDAILHGKNVASQLLNQAGNGL